MSIKCESVDGLAAESHDTRNDKSRPVCWNWEIWTFAKLAPSTGIATASTAKAALDEGERSMDGIFFDQQQIASRAPCEGERGRVRESGCQRSVVRAVRCTFETVLESVVSSRTDQKAENAARCGGAHTRTHYFRRISVFLWTLLSSLQQTDGLSQRGSRVH